MVLKSLYCRRKAARNVAEISKFKHLLLGKDFRKLGGGGVKVEDWYVSWPANENRYKKLRPHHIVLPQIMQCKFKTSNTQAIFFCHDSNATVEKSIALL
jgi:hypothetical protein